MFFKRVTSTGSSLEAMQAELEEYKKALNGIAALSTRRGYAFNDLCQLLSLIGFVREGKPIDYSNLTPVELKAEIQTLFHEKKMNKKLYNQYLDLLRMPSNICELASIYDLVNTIFVRIKCAEEKMKDQVAELQDDLNFYSEKTISIESRNRVAENCLVSFEEAHQAAAKPVIEQLVNLHDRAVEYYVAVLQELLPVCEAAAAPALHI